MADRFAWLNVVPTKSKYYVSGYVRNVEQLFPKDNPYYNIPSLITYIIIHYYYQREIFAKYGKFIKVNEDDSIATMGHPWKNDGIYGDIIIDFNVNCMYQWKIKMLEIPFNCDRVAIGIMNRDISDDLVTRPGCYMNRIRRTQYCGYWNTGSFEGPLGLSYDRQKVKIYKQNDIMTMVIDTKDKTMKYIKNYKHSDAVTVTLGIEKGAKGLDFTKQYCLAITITGRISLQLLEFQQHFI